MLVAALLLFAGLGHYPLWDDESYTALAAKGIMRTGDTSVVIDHNLVAYRNGIALHGLFDRFTPPLASCLAAPFIGRDGSSAFRARLPFAACGFAAICLLLWWTRRSPVCTQILVALGTLGNASLLLYLRQCRYYAPVVLLSVMIAWIYLHGRHRRMPKIAALSVLLFAASQMACAGLYLCLAADYLLWGRRDRPFVRRDWIALTVTLAVCCIPLALIWNPYRTAFAATRFHHTLGDHVRLCSAGFYPGVRAHRCAGAGADGGLVEAGGALREDRPHRRLLGAPLSPGIILAAFRARRRLRPDNGGDLRLPPELTGPTLK